MVFKKRSYRKGAVKRTTYKKRSTKKTASLVKLIKKVSLKQCETKNTHGLIENIQLYHNTQNILTGLLSTNQGIADTNSGNSFNSCRIGDQLIARGLSVKLWLANKLDRPNVMYKVIIFKYQSQTPPSDIFVSSTTANLMLRDVNTEKITIVYSKTFNLQVGFSAYPAGTLGDQEGREAHKLLKMWIPMKNKKITYDDNQSRPKYQDYGLLICPYDSYGSLTTDNIASYALNYKFYFKDP